MEEQELIELLKEGNEAAFKIIVDRWQNMVYNTALGMLQNENDAEDIAQEVFVQVYESIGGFKSESKFSTWVYRITVTKSLDAIRKKNRKKRFGLIRSLYGENNEVRYEVPEFNHPGVVAEQKENAAFLFMAVQKLPENQKIAFVLNKMEMLSYKEIGDIMKLKPGAVDSLLQRAKKNLRVYLEGSILSEG